MKIPSIDVISEFIGQYYIDNNLEPPSNEDINEEWLKKEYKRILKSPKIKSKEEENSKGLTKQDLEDIQYWKDKMDINKKKYDEFKSTGKVDGKKVPLTNRNTIENNFMNNRLNWKRRIDEIKFRPELKRIIKETKDAYKSGEITKKERDKIIEGSKYSLSDELDLKRRIAEKNKNIKPYDETKARDLSNLKMKILRTTPKDFEDFNKGAEYEYMNDYENAKKEYLKVYKRSIKNPDYKYFIGSYYEGVIDDKPSKTTKTSKTKIDIKKLNKLNEDIEKENKKILLSYKTLKKENKDILRSSKVGNIMKASSELKKKGDKYTVDTEMKIKKGLDDKTKKALKKSVIQEFNTKIKGSGVRKIELDYSSSEDEKPKKGKGLDDYEYSSSDEDDIKEYGKILKHLIEHIKDPKEKIDKRDYVQATELIKKIKSKKT